jgi:hypothetical protein
MEGMKELAESSGMLFKDLGNGRFQVSVDPNKKKAAEILEYQRNNKVKPAAVRRNAEKRTETRTTSSGHFTAANITQPINDWLKGKIETSSGLRKVLYLGLYAVTHPLFAPISETGLLYGLVEAGKHLIGFAAISDPTGFVAAGLLIMLVVSLLFSVMHFDFIAAVARRDWREAGILFAQRLVGGLILTAPIVFASSVPLGLLASAVIHLVWNFGAWSGLLPLRALPPSRRFQWFAMSLPEPSIFP